MLEAREGDNLESAAADALRKLLEVTSSGLGKEKATVYVGTSPADKSMLIGLTWKDFSGEPCKIEVRVSSHVISYRAGQNTARTFDSSLPSFCEGVERSILSDIHEGRCVFTYDHGGLPF